MTVTDETRTDEGRTGEAVGGKNPADGDYIAPGRIGSLVEVKLRYDNFIGGTWVAPVNGRYMVDVSPVDGKPFMRGRHVDRRGRRAGPRRRPRRQGCLGRDLADRAGRRAQRHRRCHRGQPRDAGRGRDLGERQAGARDPGRRHPAGRRPLPLLRRGHPLARGSLHRDRQGHRRVSLPRAARRGRTDHPVQLPAADGGVEDRPGAGGRQLHGGQAGIADPVVDPQAGRGHRRRRAARVSSTS